MSSTTPAVPSMGARSRLAVGALALMAWLSFAGIAQGAPTWLQPATVADTTQAAAETEVAMDRNGNVVAVWSRSNSTNTIIQAAARPAGGSFGPTQNLSTAGADASLPNVEMDANGNAVAVWVRAGVVQIASSPADGTFGAPQNASDGALAATVPDLDVAADGTAIVTWIRNGFAQAIVRQPNGSLGAVATLSDSGARFFVPCCRADIAMNARGDAVVSWDETDGEVRAVYRPAGGSFSAAPGQLLASSSVATGSAIDPNGNATVVWKSNGANAIQGSFRAAGTSGTFTPAETITGSTTGTVPTVAMDSEGTAIAVWITEPGFVVQTATRRLNQAFTPAQNITPSGLQALYPMVVVDGLDGVLVTWRRVPDGGGGTYLIQGASRSKNGPFDVRNVSESGVPGFSRPTIDADANGNGILGLERSNGTRSIAQIAGFDAGAPDISVNVPTSATAGQAVGFSASVKDVWSDVIVNWDFGDGGGATGNAVSHAFGTPGTYLVRATATDAVGNQTTTSTRTIQIASPPPPPLPPLPPTPPGLIPSTVGNNWAAGRTFTTVISLAAKRLPADARVNVKCKTKSKRLQRKRCPYASRNFRAPERKNQVNLAKLFRKKKLPVGTKITVTITAPGFIGKKFAYTIRRRAIPRLKLTCLAPGSTKSVSCPG